MPISPETGWRDRTADALFAASAAIFVAAAIAVLAGASGVGAFADIATFAATWAFLVAMPLALCVQLAVLRARGSLLLRRLGFGLFLIWAATVAYVATLFLV